MNPTTEKTLLGALVLSEKAVQVGDGLGLSSSWFVAGSKPASIFAALCRVRERGEPVDIVTVQLECGEEWAARYLQDCVDAVGLSSHAPAYVRAAATEHARLTAGLMAQAFADAAATTPAGEVSSWIADFAESLRGVLPPAEEGEGVDAVCQRVIGELKNSKTVGLPWPWADIGQTIGNVRQDIIIIQGDRGAGKTAFMVQWVAYLCMCGHCVAVRSLEMSTDEILLRAMQHLSKVNPLTVYGGRGRPEQYEALDAARQTLAGYRLILDDRPATIGQLSAWADEVVGGGAEILFVDCFRHIGRQSEDDLTKEFARISMGIKAIQKRCRVPIAVLHHTNAVGKSKWCTDIEADAYMVVNLLTDEQSSNRVKFHFTKNRRGLDNVTFDREFDKPTQTFHHPCAGEEVDTPTPTGAGRDTQERGVGE